jgi:membrane-associated phospholipid phosphatase
MVKDRQSVRNNESNLLSIFIEKHKKLAFSLLSVFLFISFFIFSFIVKKLFLNQFDFNTTVRIQDDIPLKLDKVFPYFSSLASVQVMTILLITLLIFRRQIFRGIGILCIFFASHVVELFGKVFINHPPPPFMFYKHIDATSFSFAKYYVQNGNSYPSGHSLRIVFIAIIFIYTIYSSKRFSSFVKFCLALSVIGVVCIVGVSRVALGEHWTSDVIGGWLFGLAAGIFSLLLV